MDFQQETYTPDPPCPDKRSAGMSLASLILGIVALVTCSCIYVSVICGSLSILLALLSRGGETTMNAMGRTGLILGSIGLIITFSIYIAAFLIMLRQYGGIDGILQNYMNLYNVETIEEVYQSMGMI